MAENRLGGRSDDRVRELRVGADGRTGMARGAFLSIANSLRSKLLLAGLLLAGLGSVGVTGGRAAWAAEPAKSAAGSASVAPEKKAEKAAEGDESGAASLQARLKQSAQQLAGETTYTLRYKFQPGETLRWNVVQLVTVDTKIRGTQQTAKTRSASTKSWRVESVDANGATTFVHRVDDAQMWQSVSGRPDVKYDSRVDATAPREYEHVAKSVGVPLATITMSASGRVLGRQNAQPQFSPGPAELTIPLPEGPVRTGAKWHVPDEVRVRLEDGRVQRVVTRQVFTLQKVETGVATIGIRTEVLTPVNDPKVEAQLVQRLANGTAKFDIDAGRLRSKQVDLDETVIGFSGPDSVMQYLARVTEELRGESAEPPRTAGLTR